MDSLFFILLGALAYRVRGGLIDQIIGKELPNALIRSVWALAVSFKICLLGSFAYVSPIVFLSAYLGVAFGYLGKFDLAERANRTARNYALLTIDGMKIMFPLAVFMSLFGFHGVWYSVALGALFVPCEFAGIFIYRFFRQQAWTQWAELMLGGLLLSF